MKFVLFFFLLIFIFCGCNTNRGDTVLLKIGRYKLSVRDYDFIRNNEKYKSLTDEELQFKLIEDGRILAFALNHKFDTIAMLNKRLAYAMRYYSSKVDGYVWNKKVKPRLNISEEMVRNVYRNRSYVYNLEAIHIPKEHIMIKYGGPKILLRSKDDFDAFLKKTSHEENVKFSTFTARYPFYPLGVYRNGMLRAKVGDVFGPFQTLNGYYIVYIKSEKKFIQDSYEKERSAIRQELLFGLTQKYIWESQQHIISSAKPEMHETAIKEMCLKYDSSGKKWLGIDPNQSIMDYDFANKRHAYSVADFIEFVNCQPLFSGSISEVEGVKKMLSTFLIGKYLFAEAQQMNMEKDEGYLMFRRYYRNNLFVHHFKQTEIHAKITVEPWEIKKYDMEKAGSLFTEEQIKRVIYQKKEQEIIRVQQEKLKTKYPVERNTMKAYQSSL